MYFVDYARAGPDVHAVAHDGSLARYVRPYGGELAYVHIVAYHHRAAYHGAAAVLYVESVAYACACRYEEAVALIAVQHGFGKGVEPAFILRQAEPEREPHAGARQAPEPYAEQRMAASVVPVVVRFYQFGAVGVAAGHRNAYVASGHRVCFEVHNGQRYGFLGVIRG